MMFRKQNFAFILMVIISTLFLTGCPGASDFDIDLPSDYSIVRLSGDEVIIAPKISDGSWGEAVIPAKVTEAGWNDEYIIVKQVELIKDQKSDTDEESQDETNDYFWVIEHKYNKVIGPLDEGDFTKKKQEFQISHEVDLKKIDDLEKNYSY